MDNEVLNSLTIQDEINKYANWAAILEVSSQDVTDYLKLLCFEEVQEYNKILELLADGITTPEWIGMYNARRSILFQTSENVRRYDIIIRREDVINYREYHSIMGKLKQQLAGPKRTLTNKKDS